VTGETRFRPVVDETGKTVGYVSPQVHPAPKASTRNGIPNETAGRSFWGAYYHERVSAGRPEAA